MKRSGYVLVLGCLLATAAMGQPATDYWEKVVGVDIQAIENAWVPNVLFASVPDGRVYAGTWRGLYESRDHGETWDVVALPDDRGQRKIYALFAMPDGRVWATYWDHVFYSANGETWENYGPRRSGASPSDMIYSEEEEALFVGSELGINRYRQGDEAWETVSPIEVVGEHEYEVAGYRLTMTQNGGIMAATLGWAFVYRTQDQGGSWTRFDDGLPTQEEQSPDENWPADLVIDGTGTLFYSLFLTGGAAAPKTSATAGYGTFRSRDNGETWERINGLFPCSLECQERVPRAWTVSNGKVFTAIREGGSIQIIYSEDGGDTWHDVGPALEVDLRPMALEIDADGYAYIGFYPDALYRSTQPAVVTATEEAELPRPALLHASYPNPVRTQTTITYEVQEPGPVRLRLFNLLGQEVATLVNASMPTGTYQYQLDAAGLPAGVYVYGLETGSIRESQFLIRVR